MTYYAGYNKAFFPSSMPHTSGIRCTRKCNYIYLRHTPTVGFYTTIETALFAVTMTPTYNIKKTKNFYSLLLQQSCVRAYNFEAGTLSAP